MGSEVFESEATSSKFLFNTELINVTNIFAFVDSAVWNMIKAHQKAYFSTSPPQYDIYNLRPDHYLKRPHVAWDEVENSRKKCEKWLDECEAE